MPRQRVARLEPCDFAAPEDVEAGSDRGRIVKRRDTEIDRLRLMIDFHQEWRPAFAAKGAVAEARRLDRPHRVSALGPFEIAVGNAGENHCRCAAGQLAGAAMAPTA